MPAYKFKNTAHQPRSFDCLVSLSDSTRLKQGFFLRSSYVISRAASRGFVMGYLLFALALLSLLIGAMSKLGNTQAEAKRTASVQDELLAQAETIRAKIDSCVINFPAGDNGLGYRKPYPAAPVSGLVADLTCPGAPVAVQAVWNGSDGLHAPRTIPGLASWRYENTASAIVIVAAVDGADSAVAAALRALALRFGAQGAFSDIPTAATRITLVN